MKILVTGGAGFIGSHLVKRLVRDQLGPVSVYDNFSRGSIEGLSGNRDVVRVVEGDILDPTLLRTEMVGTAIVFHLAAISSVFDCECDPEGASRANVEGTRHVLSAARDAGARRVVFTSSREVYGDPERLPVVETAAIMPKNAYGATKAAAEGLCREFSDRGLAVSVLRLSNVYGIGDRGRVIPEFVKQALLGAPLTVYGREKQLDFLWIENALDVLVRAARDPGPCQPVNVGSGKGIRVNDLARRVCGLTGQKSVIHVVNQRKPEVGNFIADVTAARKRFGLKCPVDPLEYLPLVIRGFEKGSDAVEGDRDC
jgi:UDP-glucose 4-epimerase